MTSMTKLLGAAAVGAFVLAGCTHGEKTMADAETSAKASTAKDIVTLAAGTDDLSTLVAAVTAADLVGTLQSDGPFTVFAPTNAAFDKLPDGTVATLLKPENKGTLKGILTYHVVAGDIKAADLIGLINDNKGSVTVDTVAGGKLSAALVDGAVILTDAKGGTSKVIATDVDASNGVVHLIDTVVMP